MSMTQAEQTAPRTPMTSKGDLSAVMTIATPALAEQFLEFCVGTTDTWLAGNCLSEANSVPAVAAVGLMSYTCWMIFVICASIGIGATAVVARNIGANNWKDAEFATEQAISLGLILSVITTFVLWFLADDYIAAMQLEGKAYDMALLYLRILIPAIPGFMMIAVTTACLHGAGDTVTGLIVMTIVNILNIAISAALAIGVGPIPKLGWSGIAIGTAVSHVIGGLLLLAILFQGRAHLKVQWRGMWPNVSRMRRLLRVGLPGGLNDAIVLSSHLWYLGIINSLGTTQAAAHGLAIRLESPGFLSAWAFSVAASSLTGQHLGANNPKRATRATLVSLSICFTMLSLYSLTIVLGGNWLTDVFLGFPQEGTTAYSTSEAVLKILWIMAACLPFYAVFTVLSGSLRGAGDTTWPLLITFIGFLLIRMPATYWLAWETIEIPLTGITLEGVGWGLTGAWLAMLLDNVARMILMIIRYRHGAWTRIEV
ncbi:MATE family efflux transporter [Bremerella sp. T1]|uniref:MATE family efflux transporter n=1 Tax=Bremerella sp. TYQ1 TaxID=3119568 RepID=UPI001CCC89AD|nr:MATE family efflux transporter [Bremerella volcania]UBM34808.1 MATE family efflux transporter [Bremerella volcania]